MSRAERANETYLLDVNVLVALLSEDHVHHELVSAWFNRAELQWRVCAFTEAGFVRNATAARPGQVSMAEATELLERLALHPGYGYVAIDADWRTLCGPLFLRLYGTKQVTDAYLLGLALRKDLVLATLDKAIVHLAGAEYADRVLLLQ